MFAYSERPGTLAAKKYPDDVSETVKKSRLDQIIKLQQRHSLQKNQNDVGKIFKVLIEGTSKRSAEFLQGRNSANKVVVFPKENYKKGEYVNVTIDRCSSATLIGKVVN
jgi:tRNA-2-methylthio-N6-dimethylallyladenosine synthase